MTREEQIQKLIDEENGIDNYGSADYQVGVCDGVRLADANPKSPWISVEEDLPCNHKELMKNKYYTKKVLVILAWNGNPAKRHIELCDMCSKIEPCDTNWSWRKPTYYHVTHWMPLPELPKE